MLVSKDGITRKIQPQNLPTFLNSGWVEVKDEVKETPKDNTRKK